MASFKICLTCSQVVENSVPLDENLHAFISDVLQISNLPQRICNDCHQMASNMLAFKQKCDKSIWKIKRICPNSNMILGGFDAAQSSLPDQASVNPDASPSARYPSPIVDPKRHVKKDMASSLTPTTIAAATTTSPLKLNPEVNRGGVKNATNSKKTLFKCKFCHKFTKTLTGMQHHVKYLHPEKFVEPKRVIPIQTNPKVFDATNEKHLLVHALWSDGASGAEIRRQVVAKYGDNALSRDIIYNLMEQFRQMGGEC